MNVESNIAGRHAQPGSHAVPETLGSALGDILRHPVRTLVAAWNWKTAAMSLVLRASTFLLSNQQAGRGAALRAATAEALVALLTAGVLGAAVQRVRFATPRWATALTVCIGLPALFTPVQWAIHRLAGTPHLRTGLAVSFSYAAIASGLTWWLQRNGLLVVGKRS